MFFFSYMIEIREATQVNICIVLLSAFFHMTISGEFVLDAARRGVS